MAIVQISRITQRKGLQDNLPQLAGAELGWSIDERRLFIGNGTLEEGAPVIGNTEILTEFSDIFEFQSTYTYKGEAAGYVVQTGTTAGNPVTQSLQSWLDQFATVKDFGAVGDGDTDDTEAINRALYQLYCREVNPQIRRSLFFPAGVYKISSTIIIPPFATLIGEGADNSVIQMVPGDDSALRAYVARTGDSLQQTGVNIGNNGAIVPQYVTVSNLGFETLDDDIDVFLVDAAENCSFTRVTFTGPRNAGPALATDSNAIRGVAFDSTPILICNTITFDQCVFTGTTYAIETDEQIQGVTVSNSQLDTLYKGIVLGKTAPVLGGPTGVRIIHNLFDNIFAQGIEMGAISLNGTGHNIFYDVGNHFNGTLSPATPIIDIDGDNNISIGDMFERSDASVGINTPRIRITDKLVIATTNGQQLAMGSYVRQSGQTATLTRTTTFTNLVSVDSTFIKAFNVNYTITRDTDIRTGVLCVAYGVATPTWADDYNENAITEVELTVITVGTDSVIQYKTSASGATPQITYSISHLA
jgi:hypothetical protein